MTTNVKSKEYRQHVGEGLLQLIMYMTKINFDKKTIAFRIYATNCFKNKPHHSSFILLDLHNKHK